MIIDTSVIIALYHESDIHHSKAIEKFNNIENVARGDKIIISDYQLNEIISVALRKIGLQKAKMILDTLLNLEITSIRHTEKNEFYEMLEIFKIQKSNFNFVDCAIIWLAEGYNQKVITFDGNLADRTKK